MSAAPDGKAREPMKADARTLMRLAHVNRTFAMGEVRVEVLKNLSLDIFRGELLAIVGPSGSG
ncbi:MAG: hypothetical protein KDA47_16980, partial [Planctomycetales bacterium]|nr:hypothetical protein [Planctomycetales bacterium]